MSNAASAVVTWPAISRFDGVGDAFRLQVIAQQVQIGWG